MKELKTNRKTRYTQMVLRDSLIELMKKKPIAKISITELCENADINRTTFYTHYTDQFDLLHKIEDETLSWLKEAMADLRGKTDKKETLQVIEEIFQYLVDNSRHLQVLMSEQGDIEFQKKLMAIIYQQSGMIPLLKADLVSKEFYFIFMVNGSVGLIQHWLKNGLNQSAKEMAEIIFNMATPIL